MYDLLIRGGTVVDGTGAGAVTADVAVKDGTIIAVGRIAGPARETIDADGALVTPGFVDVHTHYDGQFLWDETMDPSFSHGVTTAIAGNCGVGFAPLRREYRQQLIELMEGVEDIPGIVLDHGMDWDWTSFGDYLDRLGERRYSMDVASHIPHAPLRVAVMGERALRHERATGDDLEAMSRIVREAMAAGAIGFSGARILDHLSSKGAHVPGTFAEDEELAALARAMGAGGHGTFQIVPLGATGDSTIEAVSREERKAEHDRLARIAAASGRPLTYLLLPFPSDPDDWRMMVSESTRHAAAGLRLHPQVASRSGGVFAMLGGSHPFNLRPSYRRIAHLPVAQRAVTMRDPELRARILAERDDVESSDITLNEKRIATFFARYADVMYPLGYPFDFELSADQSTAAQAARSGVTHDEYVYDYLIGEAGRNVIGVFHRFSPAENIAVTYEMLNNPLTISGLGDGGAHLGVICDASMPTSHLMFWARDRKRGPRLPLELIVNQNTKRNADLYGLDDRGVIAPGKRADINIIDFANLDLALPHVANDLPAGGRRVLQGSSGYLATVAGGTITRRNDSDTGARPGRLIRGGR